MDALAQGSVQGQSQGQELGQAMPMSGTAGSATTTKSTPALQALVLWAQYLLKHRSQELSLSELIRRIYALSPLPQPIRYRYQISLSPRTQNIAQVKLLPSGQVEISVFTPSLVSLDGPLPLEFLQDLNLQVQDGQRSVLDFISLLTERFSQLYAQSSELSSGQSVHHAAFYEQLGLALLGANSTLSYQLPEKMLLGSLSALKALDQGGAPSLQRLLQQVLGCKVQIKERVFAFYPLPQPLRTCLGRANCTLGREVVLGNHYPSTQRRFALILGPLDYAQFVALQPQQAGHRYLRQLLSLALGPRSLECEVEYRLRKSQAVPLTLNGKFALGQGTILCSRCTQLEPALASAKAVDQDEDRAEEYWSWREVIRVEAHQRPEVAAAVVSASAKRAHADREHTECEHAERAPEFH
ncbi:MAG TPA: type VI secretion system baseplate subunit TssG [Candidatus Anaerobiospirillum pullistercoris]|uniref:Type VI secretion system baseplate subunit TssG n=1 Tax=Candidatus Anaerobiospirillum pullistercoris TaxID=2838452 RepID=A0A9D2AZM0_9GAMM|nr:type VI secretion system baseplate subunit TssG [Candidatus Anaerobiospirillum pullistercoris]